MTFIQPNCIFKKDGPCLHQIPQGIEQISILPPIVGQQPNGVVTWSLENSSGDISDHEKEFFAIAYGITQWGLRCKNISFRRVKPGSGEMVPIKFLKPGDPNYSKLFPSDSTLAVTYYPIPHNGAEAGHMYINGDSKEIWSLDGKPIPCSQALATGHATGCVDPNEMIQTYELTTVTRHEFGHALGFQHVSPPGNTMYAYYSGMIHKLGPEDIQYCQNTYGIRVINETLVNAVDDLVENLVGLV